MISVCIHRIAPDDPKIVPPKSILSVDRKALMLGVLSHLASRCEPSWFWQNIEATYEPPNYWVNQTSENVMSILPIEQPSNGLRNLSAGKKGLDTCSPPLEIYRKPLS